MGEKREAKISEALSAALEQIGAGIEPVDLVGDIPLLESFVGDFCDALISNARAAGASWADIADRLGVSRQAAHKRFGKNRGEGLRIRLRFERQEED